MIYKPQKGSMWDPSVFWYDGKYYAIMMYNPDHPNKGLAATCGLIAESDDGVHWRDGWEVAEEIERERGCKFLKAFIGRLGDRFIMDHGVRRPEGQDTLRFYESTDLRDWTYLFSNHPDPRWYVATGRWDHMYILPKEEGHPNAGYWGYPVATPKEGLQRGLGMMASPDGREWTILPPPEIDWGDVPQKDLEIGGCERIGHKYVLIGGYGNYISDGYSMYTLIGDDPRGPFRPDVEAYRLCGTSSVASGWGVSFLASWGRGKDGELLISNYVSVPSGTWMLPLRKAVFDDGHLRLGWWDDNKALKGTPVDPGRAKGALDSPVKPSIYDILWLDRAFDLKKGAVLEGTVRAARASKSPSAGFVLEEAPAQSMVVCLGIGSPANRETHIGRLHTLGDGAQRFESEDLTGKGCATVTGIEDGREHTFRLLLRHDVFELYIDDLLMQTYVYQPSRGKVGFLASSAQAVFDDLKAWEMRL
jgi:hypothetical protein